MVQGLGLVVLVAVLRCSQFRCDVAHLAVLHLRLHDECGEGGVGTTTQRPHQYPLRLFDDGSVFLRSDEAVYLRYEFCDAFVTQDDKSRVLVVSPHGRDIPTAAPGHNRGSRSA